MTPAFDNSTLWQRVYEHLRTEIIADRLPPGTELSEVALSRELSVSRGPIREAMGRLEADGLVTVRPRRGAEVREITPRELIDAYQVREALEVLAVRLAVPQITEPDLDGLSELAGKMTEQARDGAVADFCAANAVFHDKLCELSGNEKLIQVYRRLAAEIGRFDARTAALRGNLDGSASQHHQIIAAIRARDADQAAGLAAAHIRVPAERLREILGEQAADALTASSVADDRR